MRFFSKQKQQPGWMALGFNAQGVSIAHIRRQAEGRPEVLRCEFHRWQAAGSEALAELSKEIRFDQYQCTTLLNLGEYQLLQVEAPNVLQDELKAAIRWRVKDFLNYSVDDAMVDALDIPQSKNAPARTRSMYAVVAPKAVVQQRVSLFEDANIPLSVIDIPELAQRNIAALFEHEGKGLALLSFDSDGGLLTLTCSGELYLSRRIDASLQQLNDADETLRKQHFDRVVLELQRSFDYFDRNYSFITLDKLMLAPLPESIGLEAHLAANLYLPVETPYVPMETLNLAQVLDFTATPALNDGEAQAQYFQVLGAALRHEEKSP